MSARTRALITILIAILTGCSQIMGDKEKAVDTIEVPSLYGSESVPGEDPNSRIKPPPLKQVAPGVFEIGGVKITKQAERVEFTAVVNMNQGLLEYLIVGSSGKLHESLLRTEVEPYCLQIALLMIGLEGTTRPLAAQGDPRRPEGDPVSIGVSWQEAGRSKKARIETWIARGTPTGKLQPMHWTFTGSVVSNGIFMAQVEQSMVAVFHDPAAIIDNPLPEGGSDDIWFVHEQAVPPLGTAVTVIIQKETIVPRPSRGKP